MIGKMDTIQYYTYNYIKRVKRYVYKYVYINTYIYIHSYMYQLTQLEPRLEVALQYRLKEREATSPKVFW